jgi:hypothetical protein
MMGFLLTGCTLVQHPKRNSRGIGNLGLEIWASKTQLKVGESVDLRFTATNMGDGTDIVRNKNKPVMDIRISYGYPENLIDSYWSDSRETTPELTTLELAPGESKTIEMTWTASEGAEDFPVAADGILRKGTEEYTVFMRICVEHCGKE